MTDVTEAVIKAALDGTFTRMMHDGAIKTFKVASDLPPVPLPAAARRAPGEKFGHFTEAEDSQLIRFTQRGMRVGEIAYQMGRKYNSVHSRQTGLRKLGRL